MPVVESLRSAAQVVLPKPGPLGGALVEETALITRWLSQPGVRIVCATEGFASPVHSAGQWQGWAATARTARLAASDSVAVRQPESDSVAVRHPASDSVAVRHPGRQQTLGGAGIECLGGPVQPLLPGRQPFGVAG